MPERTWRFSGPNTSGATEDRGHIEEQRRRAEEEGHTAEEAARTVNFWVRFAYRDSFRTWARLIATNEGPAVARNAVLDVWGEVDGQRVEAPGIEGMDFRTADTLPRNGSVHTAVVFSFGSPKVEDLWYRLTWEDDREGTQEKTDRVPLPA